MKLTLKKIFPLQTKKKAAKKESVMNARSYKTRLNISPLMGSDEVYKYAQTQMPLLPSRLFPNQPIENYKGEIDRVFNLLNSRN